MSNMFFNCLLLEKIPNISKWNINKRVNINNIFDGCLSLSYLPNIFKLNDDIIEDNKFLDCHLNFLPITE